MMEIIGFASTYLPILKIYGTWLPALIGLLLVAKFIKPLRSFALTVAGFIVGALIFFQYGDHTGSQRVWNQWMLKLDQEAKDGETARTDAESDIRNDTPDSVRDDPRNRDNWK